MHKSVSISIPTNPDSILKPPTKLLKETVKKFEISYC